MHWQGVQHLHSLALQPQLEGKVSDQSLFNVGDAYASPQLQESRPQAAAFFGASVVYIGAHRWSAYAMWGKGETWARTEYMMKS